MCCSSFPNPRTAYDFYWNELTPLFLYVQDLDVLILSPKQDPDIIKRQIAAYDPSFEVISSTKDAQTSRPVLWYNFASSPASSQTGIRPTERTKDKKLRKRIKVDILVPGIMRIPSFPPTLVEEGEDQLPLAPLKLLLLLKVQAWSNHRASEAAQYTNKLVQDRADLQALMTIAKQRGLVILPKENHESYLSKLLIDRARSEVQEYVNMHAESREEWASLGFDVAPSPPPKPALRVPSTIPKPSQTPAPRKANRHVEFYKANPAGIVRGKNVSMPVPQPKSRAHTTPPVPPQTSVPIPGPSSRRTSYDKKSNNPGPQPRASPLQPRRNAVPKNAGTHSTGKPTPVATATEPSNATYIVNNHFYLSEPSGFPLGNGRAAIGQIGLIPNLAPPGFPQNFNPVAQQNGNLAVLFQLYQQQQSLVNRNMMMAIMGMSQTGGGQVQPEYQIQYDA